MTRPTTSTRKPDRRTQKTREEIYQAAVALFLRRGVHDVTMQDIADHADMARSTVFNHYPSKVDLLDAFYRRFAASVIEGAKARKTTGFRAALDAFFDALGRAADAHKPILRDIAAMALGRGPLAPAETEIDTQMIDFLTTLVARGVSTGEVRADAVPREIAELLLGIVTATNHEWVNKGQVDDLGRLHKQRFELLRRGLTP